MSSKCHEPNSPWVRDRALQNNCSFFEFRPGAEKATATTAPSDVNTEAERAKEAFRALFRNA